MTQPHGEELRILMASPKRAAELKAESIKMPSWDLTERQLCDIELLINGGFSPLAGFMGEKDYKSVVENMRLANGTLWPIPITLDVKEEFARQLTKGAKIALRNPEGVALAVMTLTDISKPDLAYEAEKVYGTPDKLHPGVAYLLEQTNPVYLGGTIEGLEILEHHSFEELRHTPAELREMFAKRGWKKVVAFQTRNPLHRAHYELTIRASRQAEASFLLQPAVGITKPGDIDYFTRVRCYQALLKYYPQQTTALSLLPLAMRMAGPREALWHAIIRKNHGCTHFIIGRDHAGPGKNSKGEDFYGPYDAQKLAKAHEKELGISILPFEEMVYVEEKAQYAPRSEVPNDAKVLDISGTELRRRLHEGLPLPEWFSFPEVISELRKSHPERNKQGFTVFFTGFSGSGKSTIAKALQAKLMETGERPVTLLDGDVVRKHLSSELGFSREHRDLNNRRIGDVASEIVKNRGIAICAPISPYDSTRKEVRKMISQHGGFILVYLSTPLEICEKRDRKGLYAKARAGLLKEFTGISDPYEIPEDAQVTINTAETTPEEAVRAIIQHLKKEGYF